MEKGHDVADGEGTRQRNTPEITYRDLWDIVNELKNQNEKSIRELSREISLLSERVAVVADRYSTQGESLRDVREALARAVSEATDAKRLVGELQIDIRNLQARMFTEDEKRDCLESAKAWRQGQEDSSTARLTRQNTLLAFALTFSGMGLLAPRLGDILRALFAGH